MILALLLQLTSQSPLDWRILNAEHQRTVDKALLTQGLNDPDPRVQRVAVRSIGRLEDPTLTHLIDPMLRSSAAEVRREAVNTMGQLQQRFPASDLLRMESDASVRSMIYATVGRLRPADPEAQSLLLKGLNEDDPAVRGGAARGLEFLYRLNRSIRPDSSAIEQIRERVRRPQGEGVRIYLLAALTTLGDRDSTTLAAALTDPSPEVRRLAIIAAPRWIEDPSPMVRYEVLRLSGSCVQTARMLRDSSATVSLMAIDQLARKNCNPSELQPLLHSSDWRRRVHALAALARLSPEDARNALPSFAIDTIWQVRASAATVSRQLEEWQLLNQLVSDAEPNVALAAMTRADQALIALATEHHGLLLKAAQTLKSKPELAGNIPAVIAALHRLSEKRSATWRDGKLELLKRVAEAGTAEQGKMLESLLSDVDPEVAALTARVITSLTGVETLPVTRHYDFPPFPSDSAIRALSGAVATVSLEGLGSFQLRLLPEEAPFTVATFVNNAENGRFNGLDFHRVVPNFVVQGGSPGASEYDGATPFFMPDELGLLWHDRGTAGTSTRGHDTGDGQFYLNLVSNYRLDNTYTLFARVSSGMEVVDRIQEGTRITSVIITRATN